MQHQTTPLERPRYFPRQLMTPDDLTLEAEYFRNRLRRHNIYLHGWGVVCGALVCPVRTIEGSDPTPWVVQVQPGYILGPFGDEIVIERPYEVSLHAGTAGHTDEFADPWCTETYAEKPDGPRYIAVRYREIPTRPVRAQPAGCGCDETQCEYSRYRDGYEIGVLDACPTSHKGDPDAASGNPTCPTIPDSPWVVLAEVSVDDDGAITTIKNCACRRIVTSARDSWTHCTSAESDYPQPPA
ncbi:MULTISPECIES: hypothetical protein [Nocardia]|uniref:Uncharacterized protein n=1 Tax=Nocardia sputorum TaxID=2984338 RepID=A0ABM8D128_9NOCA|nr:hypothetical protein [Nocardia sputorum]BDU01026.1 hypothetical protein IFM12276_40540 [Nocardia sputorum]